ncbi:hypothetical protein OHA21_43820 [Actinoplanes sp. NBC_00393]|uniref:hypothetical protein n=1 Tax=Actinoplanes sp. NBC_00393 TaxID=2975953 RepID=UPI002E1FE1CA
MPRERIATWPRGTANRFSVKPNETLTGTRVITLAEINRFQGFAFDPGGAARNVDLPAAANCAGAYLMISNTADAAEIITVRTSAGATILTPTQAEAALLWCDGTSWYGLVGAQS